MGASMGETKQKKKTGQLEVVGICEFKICKDPAKTLVTYSLGSCVAVIVYDREKKLGATIHYALPEGRADPERAIRIPAMFGDSGLQTMFKEIYSIGGKKENLDVYIVGGASTLGESEELGIGKKNSLLAKKLLWKSNVPIQAEDVGGQDSRSVYISIGDGSVLVKRPDGREVTL